jgi:hypothetical protein
MGTRYEDQPVEQWAGPESLDPTPVWKQYVLVALLLVVGLIVVLVVSVTSLAPGFVTPPALVPGDRLVLAATEIPAVNAPPRLISGPILDDARSFYLVQPVKGQVLALRVHWRPRPSEQDCRVRPLAEAPTRTFIATDCYLLGNDPDPLVFDTRGAPANAGTARGLDQYLVSVSGDRVIVNLSRIIESSERTVGPVPTGIPQPQQP